jgi:molybdenum cofactor biosynthesis enzyme MoaA
MPARYVHLVGADVDNAILKHYGLKSDNVEPTVKKCSFCSTINTGDVDTCENCEKPLDLKTAIEKDIKTNEIVERLEQKIDEKDKKMEEMEIRFQKQIDDVLSSLHKQNPDR